MDLAKAKIFLEKINSLYSNMVADRKNISTIERDLMKSYVQQLYESFLDTAEQPARPAVEIIKSSSPAPRQAESPAPRQPDRPAPAPPPSRPVVEQIVERPVEVAPPPPPPPPPVQVAPPKPEPVRVEAPAPEPPKPAPALPPVQPEPPKPTAPAFQATPELEDLFAFGSAKELSEKLGEMPITDIKKAMGLNDRVLTLNELFGGDQAVFDLTLDTLNKLPDFQQAKSFLMRNAATKYNWTHKEKVNKAKTFIKLVKRRYV